MSCGGKRGSTEMKRFDSAICAFNWIMDVASGPLSVLIDSPRTYLINEIWHKGVFVATYGGARDVRHVCGRLNSNCGLTRVGDIGAVISGGVK
jgi:hypothetical protein